MCPQHRNNMADINSSDQALNELKIKSDTLPGDWYVSLINPKSSEPAEIMTVSRFVELFTSKQPEVTESSKGLMSPQELMSNPGNYRVNRKCLNIYLESKKAYRIKINKSNHLNFRIKLFGRWLNGMPHGVIYKEISYANGSARESRVNIGNKPICSVYYISDPYISGESIYVDIINKANGENEALAIIEYYFNFSGFEFIENQIPRTEDLDKNNRDETDFELRSSVNTLATSPNALTDTISTSPVLESRQVRSTCLQNHLYQILLPTCLDRKGQMVQHQLEVNHRNSMSGRLTKSAALSWNYRQKIIDLNKSLISLTIARYNKCNLPRAGPPRLIN